MKRRVVTGIVIASLLSVGAASGEEPDHVLRMGKFAGELRDLDPYRELKGTIPSEERWWIVQLAHAPSRTERKKLRDEGLGLLHYIGAEAYLEHLSHVKLKEELQVLTGDDGKMLVHDYALPLDPRLGLTIKNGSDDMPTPVDATGVLRANVLHAREITLPRLEGLFPKRGAFLGSSILSPDSGASQIVVSSLLDVTGTREDVEEHVNEADTDAIVTWVEPVRPRIADGPGRPARRMARRLPPPEDEASDLPPGAGQTVNLVDSWPVARDHDCFRERLPWLLDDADTCAALPHAHATFAGGIIVTQAPQAKLISTRLLRESKLKELLELADGQGARVHVLPWHHDGGYDLIAREIDAFTWAREESLVVCSDGGAMLGSPGIANNALTVAAAGGAEAAPEHEVGGWAKKDTASPQRQPDLHAWGCNVVSAKGGEDDFDDGDDLFGASCATSWAAPRLAAHAARVRQAFIEGRQLTGAVSRSGLNPSGALLRATLIASASPVAGPVDGSVRSWGLPRMSAVLPAEDGATTGDPARRLRFVADLRHDEGIESREDHLYGLPLVKAQAVIATLAWADAPPDNPLARAVNQLELDFVDSAGRPLHGARLTRRHGVMQASIQGADIAECRIRVRGSAIHVTPQESAGQGYALVVTSDGTLAGPVTRSGPPMKEQLAPPPPAPPARSEPHATTKVMSLKTKKGDIEDIRFARDWSEVRLTGGFGTRDGESGWLGAADFDHRHASFRQIPPDDGMEGISGIGGSRVFRTQEIAVGFGAARDESAGPARTSDGVRTWAYYDRPFDRSSDTTRASWGVLADVTNARAEGAARETVTTLSPAFSFAWDSLGDCELNRVVGYATYADVEDGHDLAAGVSFSFIRGEDADDFDSRCTQASVFRKLTLDDHRNFHASFEHREHVGDQGADARGDGLSFSGQVPLLRPWPGYRHVTFDWAAGHSESRFDRAPLATGARRATLTRAEVGIMTPLRPIKTSDGYTRCELGLRLGIAGVWRDSDLAAGDSDDARVTLTFRAVLGGGRDSKTFGIRWSDVPAAGSTLNPETGTGPGGVIVATPTR